MNPRRVVGRVLLALGLAMTSIYGPPATATTTTDMSDLWWIPAESGWGIQFVQEELTIFATMFVYGPDGKPTWYVATMNHVASVTWSGTLYATTGPWFGAVPFATASVAGEPVGTITFTANFVALGTLTYTVNGMQVVKQIERETLVNQDFSGTYAGVLSQQGDGLSSCNPADDTSATPVNVQILQKTPAMTIVTRTATNTCTFAGTYSPFGRFASVSGNYVCTSGDIGIFGFNEMAVSFYEFRGRTILISSSGCTLKGYLTGLKQPPPAQ